MSVGTQAQLEVSPAIVTEVSVDAGFVKLWNKVDMFAAQLGGKWAAVARYGIEHKLSRETIVASLKSVGKKDSTAEETASRIVSLMQPENQWKLDKMESGELSVRDARSATIKLSEDGKTIIRTAPAARPASVRLADFIQSACNVAITEEISLDDLVAKLQAAYEATIATKAAKAAEPKK